MLSIGPLFLIRSSVKILLSHASQAVLVAATCLASKDDNDIVTCFFEDQQMTFDPRWNTYSLVSLLSLICTLDPVGILFVYMTSCDPFSVLFDISHKFSQLDSLMNQEIMQAI